MKLRASFVISLLVAIVSAAYIGLWFGFVTLIDFFTNVFSVVVYAFLVAVGTTILLIITGQWKQREIVQKEPSDAEKTNFRNSLFEEIRTILENLENESVISSRISYPIWVSKTDAEKVKLLGEDGYASLRQYYRMIDRANSILEDYSIEDQLDYVLDGTSRRRIIEDAERIFTFATRIAAS